MWTLGQKQLARCLFPIGDYEKPVVREIARRAGLPTAEKKDSQGICFLGQFSLDDFLRQYIPSHRGALVTTTGEKMGEHAGAEFYTIGQRHIDADFAFPKTGGASERKPLYVASKDAATNTVVVAEGSDNPALYRSEVALAQMNFISGEMLSNGTLAQGGVSAGARPRCATASRLPMRRFPDRKMEIIRWHSRHRRNSLRKAVGGIL